MLAGLSSLGMAKMPCPGQYPLGEPHVGSWRTHNNLCSRWEGLRCLSRRCDISSYLKVYRTFGTAWHKGEWSSLLVTFLKCDVSPVAGMPVAGTASGRTGSKKPSSSANPAYLTEVIFAVEVHFMLKTAGWRGVPATLSGEVIRDSYTYLTSTGEVVTNSYISMATSTEVV